MSNEFDLDDPAMPDPVRGGAIKKDERGAFRTDERRHVNCQKPWVGLVGKIGHDGKPLIWHAEKAAWVKADEYDGPRMG